MKAEQTPKCVVLIDDWQMQCCGVPFKVGEKVEWIVQEWAKTMKDSLVEVDYYYEHHSSEWQKLFKIVGFVDAIKALYYTLELHPNPDENHGCTHHRVYKKTVDVIEADGWDTDIDGFEFGDYKIVLRDFVIRPAEKVEITFS